MAASSRAAVLQSPAAGACQEEACRSLGAACRAACPVDPMAAFAAARVLGLLQKPMHTCHADTLPGCMQRQRQGTDLW